MSPERRTPPAPVHAVVVTLPPGSGEGMQVAVRQETWGVEVDVREEPHHSWLPIALAGGSFEVRP